jgi:hypothetical protein
MDRLMPRVDIEPLDLLYSMMLQTMVVTGNIG